jgi:hypothetical protein
LYNRGGPWPVPVPFVFDTDDANNGGPPGDESKENKIRAYFPETWLWELEPVGWDLR